MIQKYFFIVALIGCISIVSCRSEDEFTSNNDNDSILKEKIFKKNENEGSARRADSSMIINDLLKSDSSKVEIIDNPPPVETTHWRGNK